MAEEPINGCAMAVLFHLHLHDDRRLHFITVRIWSC